MVAMSQSCISRPGLAAVFVGNSRRGEFFLDACMLQVEGRASRERRWGSDGARLEYVSAFSVDPILYRGGDNLYEYCGDDPLTRTDPRGLASCTRGAQVAATAWTFVGAAVLGADDNAQGNVVNVTRIGFIYTRRISYWYKCPCACSNTSGGSFYVIREVSQTGTAEVTVGATGLGGGAWIMGTRIDVGVPTPGWWPDFAPVSISVGYDFSTPGDYTRACGLHPAQPQTILNDAPASIPCKKGGTPGFYPNWTEGAAR